MLTRVIRRCGALAVALALFGGERAGAVEPRSVSFEATDGTRIAGDYYPPPVSRHKHAPFVILVHGCGGARSAWEPLVPALHDAGLAVLVPDLRGHGESATTETRERVRNRDEELFREMQCDLRGAYDWLAKQPELDRARFALVGAGVGASIALQYAAKDRSVDAIVCLSPRLHDLGLDAAGDIHQVTGRKILLLAGEADRDAPYTLRERTEGVEVHIQRDSDLRGAEMLGQSPELEKRIAKFLARGVGEATSTVVYGTINSNVYHLPESGWVERIAPSNLRCYSSPAEARARGVRPSKSKRPRQRSGGKKRHD